MFRVMRGKIYKINDSSYHIEVNAEKEMDILGLFSHPFLPPCEAKFVKVFDHQAVGYEDMKGNSVVVLAEEEKDGSLWATEPPRLASKPYQFTICGKLHKVDEFLHLHMPIDDPIHERFNLPPTIKKPWYIDGEKQVVEARVLKMWDYQDIVGNNIELNVTPYIHHTDDADYDRELILIVQ